MSDAALTHPPRIPVLPVLSWRDVGAGLRPTRRGLYDHVHTRSFTSGTAALAGALLAGGVGPGDSVLVPGFNCPSMIEPIVGCGSESIIFGVGRDLSLDLDDAKARIVPSTRAILAPHYFGFAQDMEGLRTFCDTHDLLLIEDCAHRFFASNGHGPTNASGDYTIYSIRKFFSGGEGGLLTSRHADFALAPNGALGGFSQIREAVNLLEEAAHHRRLTPLNLPIIATARLLTAVSSTQRLGSSEQGDMEADSPAFHYYDPNVEPKRMSSLTEKIMLASDFAAICEARRANYLTLAERLAGVDGVSVPPMPDDVVPYMVPVTSERVDREYAGLRQAGVPLYRWDQSDTGECLVSRYYSRHLLQVPCHQSLRTADLEIIGDALASALQ